MTSIREINSDQINEETLAEFIPRITSQFDAIQDSIISIIQSVKESGDNAIVHFTEKYDNVLLNSEEIQVTEEEISEAYDRTDADLIKAIQHAKDNLIKFHEAQMPEEWSIEIEKGVIAGQIYRPLDKLGIYIPGGRAIYPSTVLMIAAPAYVAGIKDIIMCSPPQNDKKIAPAILVAANEFQIKKIYKVGGAQAIAAMAYGTNTVPKVQKVIGPGSIWVTAAKQQLSNIIAIDSPAGPSEILIIGDESTNPNYVIVDFLSQIEHDPNNVGIIVTYSEQLITLIKESIEKFIINSKRRDIIEKSLTNNSLIIK